MATPTPPNPDGSSPQQRKFDEEPPMIIDPAKRYVATMVTSHGTMVINSRPARRAAAPSTASSSWRAITTSTASCSTASSRASCSRAVTRPARGSGGPGYRFADELPKAGRYQVGSLAMANAGPDTNGSQFFVISGPDGVGLPPLYSLFGEVVNGLDVVAKIDALGSRSGSPKERVVIESVTIEEKD